jgi:hypothetical protein
VRCWHGGAIPDRAYAVESPLRLTEDPATAQRILDLVPSVQHPSGARDDLQAGEMWNSNSVIAWLLVRSGLPTDAIEPPRGGRAPGWNVAPRRRTPRFSGPALSKTGGDEAVR